ncbi:hypothetical protein AN643_01235 [Candidatus Epulonipiscioides saccharophilum]|nr:hypothetical protein AN643_01235 [Epulopiscium sp. SCG-B10WGA-EpuloB]
MKKKIQFNQYRTSFVYIPSWFLDTQLNNIEGQHLKVYLLLQKADQEKEALDFEKIASKLQVSSQKVEEVVDSLNKKNIIRMEQKDDFNCEITINNNDREVPVEIISNPIVQDTVDPIMLDVYDVKDKPEYRCEEMDYYRENDNNTKIIFEKLEIYLERPSTFEEQSAIFSLYEWLRMSIELIDYLLNYCLFTKQTKNIDHITSVAIDWANNKITSLDQAEARVADPHLYDYIFNPDNEEPASSKKAHNKVDADTENLKADLLANDEYDEETSTKRALYEKLEEAFGRPVKYHELEIVFNDFYKKSALPLDLIYYLLDFCPEDKKNIKYLEGIVRNWNEKGIKTIEQAEGSLSIRSEHYKILKAAAISSSAISETQREMIDKWFAMFPVKDVIYEACKVMGKNVQKPSMKYLDGILTNWNKEGIKDLSDIERVTQEYKTKKSEKTTKKNNYSIKSGRFSEMLSNNYDDDYFTAREIEYHKKLRTGQI